MAPLLTRPAPPRAPARTVRPLRRGDGTAAPLAADELAVLALADGRRSLLEIAEHLGATFEPDEAARLVRLTQVLARLEAHGRVARSAAPHLPVALVLGLEDRPYFRWQLAILLESLHAQLPSDWRCLPVVCNGNRPLSTELHHVLDAYGVRALTGRDLPRDHPIDFAGAAEPYPPLNRIEALAVVREHVADDEVVCLLDTDNFLYREIDLAAFPEGDAVCANALIAMPRFFATPEGHPGVVDLPALLRSIGAEQPFRPGGVTVFMTGATLRAPKLVADCFRFTQALYLLGRIGGVEKIWHAEMPSFALALTANGVPYQVVDEGGSRFVVEKRAALQPGAFYHYYADLADGGVDGAFVHSRWCKQAHRDGDLLATDLDALEAAASSDHERFFFQLARRARLRLAG